jgi:hypothetical protein
VLESQSFANSQVSFRIDRIQRELRERGGILKCFRPRLSGLGEVSLQGRIPRDEGANGEAESVEPLSVAETRNGLLLSRAPAPGPRCTGTARTRV